MRNLKIFLIISGIYFLISCGSSTGTGPSETKYIKSGWQYFTEKKYSMAVQSFNQALEEAPEDLEAKLGKGWSLLMKDTSGTDEIINLLKSGVSAQELKLDAFCALTSVHLVQKEYTQAINSADTLLSNEPNYVFQYNTKIDWKDITIIKAQAYFLNRNYTQAWNTIVDISELNLAPNDSKSWVIDGQEYLSFPAVLSVEIANLSREYMSF
ncbi:MAG: hypothetical protein K9M80_04540 [Candidatus Marinimicrobia bacterium]|nr:hypothetical protein [Candidatus Neomarinimicrobiota bacterium]